MALTREKKQKIIEELEEKLRRQKSFIFIDFTGLKVKDFSDLRKKIKNEKGEVKVAKKTLLDLALKKSGFEINVKDLRGEIAVVFSFLDDVSLLKTLFQFSQNNPNLKILAGFFEKRFLGGEEIVNLAKLPGKRELLGKLVTIISSPLANFIYSLKFNLKGLVNILSTRAKS
jgi:large subunit ribosomal protein L10